MAVSVAVTKRTVPASSRAGPARRAVGSPDARRRHDRAGVGVAAALRHPVHHRRRVVQQPAARRPPGLGPVARRRVLRLDRRRRRRRGHRGPRTSAPPASSRTSSRWRSSSASSSRCSSGLILDVILKPKHGKRHRLPLAAPPDRDGQAHAWHRSAGSARSCASPRKRGLQHYASSSKLATPEFARRLRLTLEDCGGMFVKFGQIASTRSDLLPEVHHHRARAAAVVGAAGARRRGARGARAASWARRSRRSSRRSTSSRSRRRRSARHTGRCSRPASTSS